jgi:hypothetical protein
MTQATAQPPAAPTAYEAFQLSSNAQLALDTLYHLPAKGIPNCTFHDMEWAHLERVAGCEPGGYPKRPDEVYMACQRATSTCIIDQYIPHNPLTMSAEGYTQGAHSATTGLAEIVLDGMRIDSPEAAVEHMEKVYIPQLQKRVAGFDEDERVRELLAHENKIQREVFGPDILKAPYDVIRFPSFRYGYYGYENYFMAYALYPDVCERCFSVEADWHLLNNRAAARAYREGNLPPLTRLDHDMADSRGLLVDVKTLDKIWFPHFARCLEPLLKSPVKLIWHCDGNLMDMVPRLLDIGLAGFQGFQCEDGMDYEKICRMRTRSGDPLIIQAGISVTRTLPHGTPDDIKREFKWLVEHAPKTGFFLSSSSSIAPGAPWENIQAFIEGRAYYLKHGRAG